MQHSLKARLKLVSTIINSSVHQGGKKNTFEFIQDMRAGLEQRADRRKRHRRILHHRTGHWRGQW